MKDESNGFIFPKRFRFAVESKAFGLTQWVKSFKYSITPKTLTIEWFEVLLDGNPIMNYLAMMAKSETTHTDHFTLKCFDGTGQSLNRIEFDRCKLVHHTSSNFAYDKTSEGSVFHTLTFEYEKAKYYAEKA